MAVAAMKKPMTPCFAYINDNRAAIRARPDMQGKGLGAVSAKGSELFKELPEEEKKKYQDKYEEERKAYEAWAATDAGKAARIAKKDDARGKKDAKKGKADNKAAKVAQKEAKAEAGCPKKPMTPCFAYIQDHRQEISEHNDVKGKGLGAVSKKGAELFKDLPAIERATYEKKYEEEKKEYEAWFKSDAGVAFAAKQKESQKAAKLAAKESKIAAKAAAKEEKASAKSIAKAGDKAVAEDDVKTPMKASKRGRGTSVTPKTSAKLGRGRGRGRGPAIMAPGPAIDAAVLAEATKQGYEAQLKNLAARPEVAASGKSALEMLGCLTKSGGLVNPAKAMLLGGA